MVTLKADNRILVTNSKFAYLTDNYQSGIGSIVVSNTEPYTAKYPILLSEMGKPDAEVLKIHTLTTATQTITLSDISDVDTTTAFSHPESTRVIAIPYDQIRFYWTAALGTIADETPTFDASNPLTDWATLDPSSFYSTYGDTAHSTGFGWFMYKNSYTAETSSVSNPIPYAGFTGNTAQQVFADFESLLNTNELKLVSTADKFSWLNEALATFKNKLNLSCVEYNISTKQTITLVSGTAEYQLPDDFSDIVEIVDGDEEAIDFISANNVMTNNGKDPVDTRYYLRNRYIGFSPTPTTSGSYVYYTYRSKAARITSLSTYIDLPDNAFYCLKDWMMYRAYMKFNNPLATAYYQSFKNSLDLFIQASVKRSANLDTWGITNEANA